MNSLTCSLSDVYIPAACAAILGTNALPFFSSIVFSKKTSVAWRVREFNQKLDHLPTQIRTRRMHKVLVDITQHPSTRLEVVKRALQSLGVTPTLRGGNGRVSDGNLEEDGRFFVGHGSLGYEF